MLELPRVLWGDLVPQVPFWKVCTVSFSNVSSSTTGRVLTKVAGHDLNSLLFLGGCRAGFDCEKGVFLRKLPLKKDLI